MQKFYSKPVIVSCFFAGCLEMYDFVIFGFLAPIINANYLSFLDESTGLIIAYLIFAVGFICRPIGAIIFGHIGDKYGRKKSLVVSMSLMGITSLAMCLLPTYKDIGIISCYLIALIRIIQGISVGGEYSGAAIFAIEHSNKINIGVVGSTVLSGTTLGVLLATFVSNILEYPSLPEYSWRFAFLLGFGLAIIGYFIRVNLDESPLFLEKMRQDKIKSLPLFSGLKKFKKEFLSAILLSGANNANYYFALVFIPNYLKTEVSVELDFNNWILALFMFVLEPTFGWLSDKWRRKRIIFMVCSILVIYNLIFLDLLLIGDLSIRVMLILISALLLSNLVATVNVYVLEIFPVEYRYSCGALSYSIGAAVFGGTTPLVCSLIIENFGNVPIYIGSYIALVSALGVLGVFMIRKNEESLKIKEFSEHQLNIKVTEVLK